jgi:hypothetical protein
MVHELQILGDPAEPRKVAAKYVDGAHGGHVCGGTPTEMRRRCHRWHTKGGLAKCEAEVMRGADGGTVTEAAHGMRTISEVPITEEG